LKGQRIRRAAAGVVPRIKKHTVIVYWLVPARPERELFRDLIRILAKPFDAPRFEPHLTIGRAKTRQSPRQVLQRVKAAPIALRVRGVSFSSKFTKTLFVRFHRSRALQKLAIDLSRDATSLRDPHLSMLYKKLPPWVKRELAAALKLPLKQVAFDKLQAVHCPSPTDTRADVESWRVIASKQLSG
jgi:hypothetical protein